MRGKEVEIIKENTIDFNELRRINIDAERLEAEGKLPEAIAQYFRIVEIVNDIYGSTNKYGDYETNVDKIPDAVLSKVQEKMMDLIFVMLKTELNLPKLAAYHLGYGEEDIVIDNGGKPKPIVLVGTDYDDANLANRVGAILEWNRDNPKLKDMKFEYLMLDLTPEELTLVRAYNDLYRAKNNEGKIINLMSPKEAAEVDLLAKLTPYYDIGFLSRLVALVRTAEETGVTVVPLFEQRTPKSVKSMEADQISYKGIKEFSAKIAGRILVYLENGFVVNNAGTFGNLLKTDPSFSDKVYSIITVDFVGSSRRASYQFLDKLLNFNQSFSVVMAGSPFAKLPYTGLNSPRQVKMEFEKAADGLIVHGVDHTPSKYRVDWR